METTTNRAQTPRSSGRHTDTTPATRSPQHAAAPAQPPSSHNYFIATGMRLLPFAITVALYFARLPHLPANSWHQCAMKCAPICTLFLFVWSLSPRHYWVGPHAYRRLILLGLTLSACGDACLVFSGLFLHGIVAFGAAQCVFAWAFHTQPVNWAIAKLMCGVGTAIYVGVGARMPGGLAIQIAVPIYMGLVGVTLTRALSCLVTGRWTLRKLTSSLGAVLFAFSDSAIGLSLAFPDWSGRRASASASSSVSGGASGAGGSASGTPVNKPHWSQYMIMITYYAAQLLFCLSCAQPIATAELPPSSPTTTTTTSIAAAEVTSSSSRGEAMPANYRSAKHDDKSNHTNFNNRHLNNQHHAKNNNDNENDNRADNESKIDDGFRDDGVLRRNFA